MKKNHNRTFDCDFESNAHSWIRFIGEARVQQPDALAPYERRHVMQLRRMNISVNIIKPYTYFWMDYTYYVPINITMNYFVQASENMYKLREQTAGVNFFFPQAAHLWQCHVIPPASQ